MQEEALLQIIKKQQELINLMLQSGIKISDTNSPNAQTFSYSATTKKQSTVNLRIAGMNAYFKYIKFTGFEFHRSKEQKKTYCNEAINEAQYAKLITWAKDNAPKVWLTAKVIAGTGVRVSELINLKTETLDRATQT